HLAKLPATVVFRLPSPYIDRRGIDRVVRPIAVLQGGKINKQLERGTGLSLGVNSTVELTLIIVAPSNHGDHCTVRSHGDESALRDAATRTFAIEHLSDDPVGELLEFGSKGRADVHHTIPRPCELREFLLGDPVSKPAMCEGRRGGPLEGRGLSFRLLCGFP